MNSILGGSNNETLIGGSGNDFLSSGGGQDAMFGGSGNDTFSGNGNSGVRILDGGGGTETAIFSSNFNPAFLDTVNGGTVSVNGVNYTYQASYTGAGNNTYFTNFAGNLQFNDQTVGIVCFAAGTMILTAQGEKPIEAIRAGDLVATLSGRGAALKPVRWVGHRDVDLATHPRAADVAPILVLPGALGQGVPHRPLRVSPEHALLVDGALVAAGLLVDGIGILRQPPRGTVRYLHIELDAHDVLVAEGAPAESYLDMGNRHAFANAGIARMLHADFAPAPGHDASGSCAPRVTHGPALDAARLWVARHRAIAAAERRTA